MKVGFVSLGCDKNRVDTERMIYALGEGGYEITDDIEEADVAVINTCAFIEDAKKEAIDNIFAVAELKKNKLKKLVVTGCFATRYYNEVVESIPEADACVPILNEKNILSVVNGLFGLPTPPAPSEKFGERILTTPPQYAYLKIADGCNNRCSYCAIPAIRGKYVSEPQEKLIAEAKSLCDAGVKELILVAQDTTYYGRDIYGKFAICDLLKELVKLDFWRVRLLYTYPELISEELIELIDNEPKIAKYLDIPMQHADDGILKKMRRRSNKELLDTLLLRLRKCKHHIAVRSTFILGFPTENDDSFRVLAGFLDGKLDYAGFFTFSPEEGTPAYDMEEKVPKKVANKRRFECEKIQCASTIKWQDRLVGTETEVLYEGIDYEKGLFYGRTEYCAPGIDTKVYFKADFPVNAGGIYKVRIDRNKFDLYGEAVGEAE